MTFDEKDLKDLIYAEMDKGKSTDDLASMFSFALNKVIAEKKAEEEKKLAEKSRREKKMAEIMNLWSLVVEFIEDYYPSNILDNLDLTLDREDAEYIIDELDEAMAELEKLQNSKSLEDLIADLLG